jgi:hypothetical protein
MRLTISPIGVHGQSVAQCASLFKTPVFFDLSRFSSQMLKSVNFIPRNSSNGAARALPP